MNNETDGRKVFRDLLCVVGGSVIDQDDFVIRIIQMVERIEACFKGSAAVEAGDDNRKAYKDCRTNN